MRVRLLFLAAAFAFPAFAFPAFAQLRASRGVPAVGAPVLSGYIIQGKPCIPIKRFGLESGYYIAVSPSGRIIGIIVNKKISNLVDGTRATTGGRDFPLSIQPLAQNNDFYVPLDFFEKVYPVRFTWNRKAGILLAELPKRTLKIPITQLPRQKPKSRHP